MQPKKNGKKKILIAVLALLGLLVAAAAVILGTHRLWARPPEQVTAVAPNIAPPNAPIGEPGGEGETGQAVTVPTGDQHDSELGPTEAPQTTSRKDGVYTILLVGNDDGQGNTDTIMFGKIDTNAHTMDFVTIPRDTLINVPWVMRKINCVYWGSRYNGGDGISALKLQISRLVGFEPDCYVVVDLDVFIDAVDLIGGVYFDVPVDMDYEDPSQDLTVHVKKGYQLLDGYQAMGVCRFRSGYRNGDLGRIETQHKFLSECASQFLKAGNIPHMPELLKLLADNLDTDLSAANMAFFAQEFFNCKPEDIRFHTPELGGGMLNGFSYVTLKPEQWLRMVNELLNPFDVEVGWSDVDIVFRTNTGYGCTRVLLGPDYYPQEEEEGDGEDPGELEDPENPGGQDDPGVPGESGDPGDTGGGSEEPAPAPDDGGDDTIVVDP